MGAPGAGVGWWVERSAGEGRGTHGRFHRNGGARSYPGEMSEPKKESESWSKGLTTWGKIMIPLVVLVGIGVLVAANLATERDTRLTAGTRKRETFPDLINLVTRSHPIASEAAFVTAWVLIVVFLALILGGSQFAFIKAEPAPHVSWREREDAEAAQIALTYGTAPADQVPGAWTPTDQPTYGQPPADQPPTDRL